MNNQFLELLLSLSVSGSIIAIVLFLVKPLVRHKMSKAVQYYLWLIVLARLILPIGIPGNLYGYWQNNSAANSSLNIQQNTTSIQATQTNAQVVGKTSERTEKDTSTGNRTASSETNLLFAIILGNLFLIWMLGSFISLLFQTTGYVRLSMQLISSNQPTPKEYWQAYCSNFEKQIPVYTNQYVRTPLLLGLLKPCIILPDMKFSEKQLRNVYLHEMTHFRRKDILIKWLVVLITSAHWFNPLMYVIKKEIDRASELACDEAVIRGMNNPEKQSYGETLLAVAADRHNSFGALYTTMNEDKRTMKERLISIMRDNGTHKISALACVAVILVTLCTLASCALIRLPNTKSLSSNPVSSVSSETFPKFISLTFKSPDLSTGNGDYTYSDSALMDQLWKSLKEPNWVEAPFQSRAESTILLHFSGEKAGWYMLTPDNFCYYSNGQGKNLTAESPLGGFAKPGDKSYKIPEGVYGAAVKMLDIYAQGHPQPTRIDAIIKNILQTEDTAVITQKIELHSRDFNDSKFSNALSEAFGNLSDWKIVHPTKNIESENSKSFLIASTIGYKMNFYGPLNLVELDNYEGREGRGQATWYQVPSGVIPHAESAIKDLEKEK